MNFPVKSSHIFILRYFYFIKIINLLYENVTVDKLLFFMSKHISKDNIQRILRTKGNDL